MAQRKVAELLSERERPRNPLERLVKRAATRDALTDQLRAVLPPRLAPHCHVGDLRGGRLTIHVTGAAWATRLRLELPQAEPALRALADFADMTEVRVRVAANPHRERD